LVVLSVAIGSKGRGYGQVAAHVYPYRFLGCALATQAIGNRVANRIDGGAPGGSIGVRR
jgi:hypothetical protein